MGKVEAALHGVGGEAANALLAHLEGGTSANYLADWLTRAGHPVSATTVKAYRRRLNASQS